ncbi:hypothetical protein C8J26_1433 [Sphingomonas aurantiaca]|uniref:Uncharacterized protein n=1 Tax=Sphingomonas aurantiaca TaxID=185949 RepID=A0A2T5GP46_9SPHN|nr:hypothetical protein C8J26_1433 [Sphingomonas aurantiaca]
MIVEPREPADLYAPLETVPRVRLMGEVFQVLLVRWWLSLLVKAYRVTRKPRLRPPKAKRTR